jgi:hypothetical protein
MVEESMEHWTSDTFSEFAIKFNSQMVVKTSEIADLIKMIDESPYKDGYDYDWQLYSSSMGNISSFKQISDLKKYQTKGIQNSR